LLDCSYFQASNSLAQRLVRHMIIQWMPCYHHIRYIGISDRYSGCWLAEKVP
jgi:hypothetical protein